MTLPSFTSCNLHLPHTHALPGKFPVLYLLHGHGNDYQAWLRYTSAERYAEEYRMAVVTFSCHNKAYQNAPLGENFYDFLNEEQNVTYRYLTVLYESDDGFWMVQFASQKSNFDAYEPSFIEAAKSVSFSA